MCASPSAIDKYVDKETGFSLDISGMDLDNAKISALIRNESSRKNPSALGRAHREMIRLESGAVKNPDEGRQVTHFTDRTLYPETDVFQDVERFAARVQSDTFQGWDGPVESVVINGIGGSALGPQLLQFTINGPYWNEMDRADRNSRPRIYFVDNTDSAGISDISAVADLSRTLIVTVSKSGGTLETLNNMKAFEQMFGDEGLNFGNHAVAVTMSGSKLDSYAGKHNWLAVFPMAESIGGRTSETNIVGHVPAALTGINFAEFLNGAVRMDEITRTPDLQNNPAYQLAAAWYVAGNGRGDRNMVVVPYSDRLVLLGRYLQQLVMESLGKEKDLDGKIVHQGLTVYGNKGGTDAHAYIQQLNDGRDDFFLTFIEVLRDSQNRVVSEDESTMGDYLHAFKAGLTRALRGKGRKTIEIVVPRLNEFYLGMLIALYERAVAVYAELIHINAFHQPGVEAYKLASSDIILLAGKVKDYIASLNGKNWEGTALEMARAIGCTEDASEVEALLSKYAENNRCFGNLTVKRDFRDSQWCFSLS